MPLGFVFAERVMGHVDATGIVARVIQRSDAELLEKLVLSIFSDNDKTVASVKTLVVELKAADESKVNALADGQKVEAKAAEEEPNVDAASDREKDNSKAE